MSYSSTYAHVVIMSTWHLTCGLVNVSYRYLTALCFHENCLLVDIISCLWDVTVFLCFCGSIGGSTLSTLGNPCINGATEVTLHHLCGYGHPIFWLRCAPQHLVWELYLGLRSCENQPPCSWLIVKLLSLLWMKNCTWSHWTNFCGLQYSAGLLRFVSWPSLQLL
jgi:hypothetical protein